MESEVNGLSTPAALYLWASDAWTLAGLMLSLADYWHQAIAAVMHWSI